MRVALVDLAYILATALFVLALHWMNDPKSARRGVLAGVAGMSLAVLGALLGPEIVNWHWIAVAVLLGVLVGVPLSRVALTAVPQRTALSHAFGGLAAGLVGVAKYRLWLLEGPENLTPFRMTAIVAEVILGSPSPAAMADSRAASKASASSLNSSVKPPAATR